jgi:HlyD family secretion protein
LKDIWAKITAKVSKKKLIIIAVVVILLVALGYYITEKKSSSQDTQQQMKTATVTKGNIEDTVTGSGTIEAITRKEVDSECTGTISKLYVTQGQEVEKGALLMTFDNDSYDSQVQAAQLNLQQAKSQLADLQEDKRNLTIYATASGAVGDSLPTVGEKVNSGAFTTITDQTHMQASASFNLGADTNINVGQEAELFIDDYLTSMKGTVSSVSTVAGASGNRICNVLITVSNPGRLTSGTTVTKVTVAASNRSVTAISSTTLEWPPAVTVQAKTAGTLEKLNVNPGEWVNKGDVLAILQSSDLDDEISDQLISIKQKQLSLDQQNTEMEKRTLYAPISGTVLAVNVTEGQEVTDNTSDLVTISCLSTLEVTVPVDELDILKVKMGQTARITSDAVSGKTFTAKVTEIAGEGTVTSGVSTFDVVLTLDDPGDLKAGMNVNAEILIESKSDVLTLPLAAITERGNKKYVKLHGNDSKTTLTEVEVGLSTENAVEITSGLKEGDVVVYNSPVTTAETVTSTEQQQQRRQGGGMMGGGGQGGPPGGGM